jgi:hypothetical protein
MRCLESCQIIGVTWTHRDVYFADKGVRDEFLACRGSRSGKDRENTARDFSTRTETRAYSRLDI